MRLPETLRHLLKRDAVLRSAVEDFASQMVRWLESSRMPFFPEFTEHGQEHVESVVASSWRLLDESSQSMLQPADAAVLVLAALVHDSALHLSEDGFVTLLDEPEFSEPIRKYGDRPWKEEWQSFEKEAARWDDRTCTEVLGVPEPPISIELNSLGTSTRDRMCTAVFIRRHHHRIAHEIALHGVPGPTATRLAAREVPEELRHLAGAVARSHGESCFARPLTTFSRRGCQWMAGSASPS